MKKVGLNVDQIKERFGIELIALDHTDTRHQMIKIFSGCDAILKKVRWIL